MSELHVLIVEDSISDAKLVVRELEKAGHEVAFERVEEAEAMRSALAPGHWDVIISDWSMPRFSASDALGVVRERGLDIPFVIVSGTVGEKTAVEAMRAGAHDYVLKDDLTRLAPAVERELRDCRDRRARRQAEEALQKSEARYRRIVETTNEGVWLIDAQARTTFVNARMAAMLGFSREEILGRSLFEFVAEPSGDASRRSLERRKTGAPDPTEIELRRKDGTELWVLIESSPSFDETGRYEGALVMVMDVTQRHRALEALQKSEEQLRQAQKLEAVGRLAGGVAHDFNNLLSVILSYSAMLAEDLKPGDPLRADLEEIHGAAERAADLTRQLLAFSRRQVLQPRLVDLNQIVGGMEKMLRRLIGEDVELSVITAPDLDKVRVDPGQIEQVVMNLAINARDAMPRGGKLTIETASVDLGERDVTEPPGATAGRQMMLAVSDNGIGMDEATRARIFEPFFTTKDRTKGTGLGLSQAFGIVQQSGGSVAVESALGRGTTLRIYLPPASRSAGDESALSIPEVPGRVQGSETILLVEDDKHLRGLTRTILRRYGYRVLAAESGGDALLLCEQHPEPIDLLLTDVVMPRMSGRQLAERLVRLRPDLRVLYMSGYTDDAILHHGVLEAGLAFLQKPIRPDTLVQKVRQVLDAPSAPSPG